MKQLVINPDSWHAKLYQFSKHCLHNATTPRDVFGEFPVFEEKTQTNICEYINAFVIRMPIVVGIWLFTYAFVFYTFIVFPFTAFSLGNLFGFLTTVFLVIAALVTLFFVAFLLTEGSSVVQKKINKKIYDSDNEINVFFAWLRSKKEKVCAFVKIGE